MDEQDNQSEDSEITPSVGRGRKRVLWPLEVDLNGHPRLPDQREMPAGQDLRDIIRAFFTLSYSKPRCYLYSASSLFFPGAHTKKEKAAVPWGQLSEDPGSRIKGWDKSIVLKDPSRMSSMQQQALYKYLVDSGFKERATLEWITPEFDSGDDAEGGHEA